VVVHYAGGACEMNTICEIAKRHHLTLIEDAAQALGSSYYGNPLGSFGDFSCFSFHETKNFSMGEGGALLVRDEETFARAEVMADCGTDRKKVRRKEATEYTWIAKGASCIPSELACMFLYPQLINAEEIIKARRAIYAQYDRELRAQASENEVTLPAILDGCVTNGHIYAIRLGTKEERNALMQYLNARGIKAAFHYIPLHSSKAGKTYGRFHGEDAVTTKESEKLLRLPLYYGMTNEEITQVIRAVKQWFLEKQKGFEVQ